MKVFIAGSANPRIKPKYLEGFDTDPVIIYNVNGFFDRVKEMNDFYGCKCYGTIPV